jgi:hypothetical protein
MLTTIAGGIQMTTGSTMTIPLSLESTIMVRAQETVDRWFRAHDRGPFKQAVVRTLHAHWPDLVQADDLQDVFYQVANAIRLGQGHALHNPGPLLRIIRQSLGQIRPSGEVIVTGD